MRSWLLVVLALASCGDREAASQVVAPKPVVVGAPLPPPAPATRSPHGGAIALLALTDGGDAALTVDDQAQIRLWPSLDGAREPVVVRGPAARELALIREHGDLIAAVLDEAGGVDVLRHDAAGGLRERARIATEPAIVQVVAAGDGFLARRGDHTLVWFDARAQIRGTLVPEPGEQISTVVARHASAVAAIADPERPEIVAVRRIELRGGVRWGARFALPEPVVAPIALSPSGRRLVALSARTGLTALIVELAAAPRALVREPVLGGDDQRVVGFIDDDRAVLPGGEGFEIGKQAPTDPWGDRGKRLHMRFARGGAVADRVVVSPIAASLAVSTPDRTVFLSYRDLAVGGLVRTPDGVALLASDRAMWLDDKLGIARRVALAQPQQTKQQLVLDSWHTVRVELHNVQMNNDEMPKDHLVLVDTPSGAEHDLGMWPMGSMLAYDARTHVLYHPSDPRTERLQLDFATGTAKPLRPFKTPNYAMIEPVDPALAGGVVAIAHMPNLYGGTTIETFVDDGRAGRAPIAPSSHVRVDNAAILGVDRAGTAWTLATEGKRGVFAHRKGKRVARFSAPARAHGGAVAPDGGTVIILDAASAIAFDPRGRERWRAPAWRATSAVVDRETVYLMTQGGVVAVDLATGARVATGCGWGFGAFDTEPNQVVFGDAPVCAETP